MTATVPSTDDRILVVDDEEDACMNLQDILSDVGYQVDVAKDGLSALQLIAQHAYGIALLDLKMPGMSGGELYRRIKSADARTVGIAITAHPTSNLVKEAIEAGIRGVLPKPVEIPKLLSVLKEASN